MLPLNWVSILSESERYSVQLTPGAEKDLKHLRHIGKDAARALKRLETTPSAGHPLAGDFRGYRSLEFSVKGSGAYRAVYRIDESERIILVFIIGPHENIYDRAKRRIFG